MEFPDLGQHCSNLACKQLDFLPMKCDACSEIFCKNHIKYISHGCEEGYKKDVQVPVCPLCNQPVPGRRDEAPDIRVSEHIDRDCQSDRAVKKRKVFANKCSKKGCKQKELMPLICDSCRLNFCLKHRHSLDHDCKGFHGTGSSISNSGFAAINRAKPSPSKPASKPASKQSRQPQRTNLGTIGADLARERREREAARQSTRPAVSNVYSMQAGMSEDEAMARALQLSMASESNPQPSPNHVPPTQKQQEEADMALARALAQSEEEQRQQRLNQGSQRQQSSDSSKCAVS